MCLNKIHEIKTDWLLQILIKRSYFSDLSWSFSIIAAKVVLGPISYFKRTQAYLWHTSYHLSTTWKLTYTWPYLAKTIQTFHHFSGLVKSVMFTQLPDNIDYYKDSVSLKVLSSRDTQFMSEPVDFVCLWAFQNCTSKLITFQKLNWNNLKFLIKLHKRHFNVIELSWTVTDQSRVHTSGCILFDISHSYSVQTCLNISALSHAKYRSFFFFFLQKVVISWNGRF